MGIHALSLRTVPQYGVKRRDHTSVALHRRPCRAGWRQRRDHSLLPAQGAPGSTGAAPEGDAQVRSGCRPPHSVHQGRAGLGLQLGRCCGAAPAGGWDGMQPGQTDCGRPARRRPSPVAGTPSCRGRVTVSRQRLQHGPAADVVSFDRIAPRAPDALVNERDSFANVP